MDLTATEEDRDRSSTSRVEEEKAEQPGVVLNSATTHQHEPGARAVARMNTGAVSLAEKRQENQQENGSLLHRAEIYTALRKKRDEMENLQKALLEAEKEAGKNEFPGD